MQLAVLTSVETRHRYFANALAENFNVVAVGYEQTGYSPAAQDGYDLTPHQASMVSFHFEERGRQEERFFSGSAEFLQDSSHCAVRQLKPGELNTAATLGWLESSGADAVAVFGTNLIKPPLLGCRPNRMLNLHLGLSPYYRGTASNFYPLLNEEPEYVGATIHLLDERIDAGPIVRHRRPEIVADDGPHTIGCKAILAGIEGMIESLRELARGEMNPVPSWEVANPRLYLRKDYHPGQVAELYAKIEKGMIRDYVQRAPRVAGRVRLIE